jgi:predicted DNA binding CopG/RHH family protein
VIRNKVIHYSLTKNTLLKQQRNIGFEDIILAIENGNLLDNLAHPNQEKYPNQNIFIILAVVKNYVYLVPYVENENTIFLKTIIPSRKMQKEIFKGQKMNNKQLDNYEQDILQSVENNEWQSKNNLDARMQELQSYIKNQKKKAISLRINANDLYEIKKKALESSIPYQNLIQILIHQFAADKISIKL